jgi:hypothetical protein
LLYPATRSPIGWKRSGSFSQRQAADNIGDNRGSALIDEMETSVADLVHALRERLAVIRDDQSRRDQTKHIARLKEISERIESLQTRLPKPVDPRLAHYLQRKSYDKALEFLEAQRIA